MSNLPDPGDLAYIVREDPACQENIGKVVTVCLDQSTPEGRFQIDKGWVWCTATQSLACIDGRTLRKDWSVPGEPLAIHRTFLRRIAGPSVMDSLTTDREVTA